MMKTYPCKLTGFLTRSVFNAVASIPIHLHLQTFHLGGKRQSAVNLNGKMQKLIDKWIGELEWEVMVVYGIVTDYPNVMVKTRRFCI